MFCLVCLLCIFSIPKVLLKPTVANSELTNTTEDEETRFKRQAAFFDLLHQAIEKYANCADIHLAPLKALAKYKQYETFAYPQRISQQSPPMEGTLNPCHHHNSPHLKCTKVNLCSIANHQHCHSPAGYNPDAAHVGINAAKQKLIPYYLPNTNNKIYMPISGLNQYVFGNMAAKFITNYANRNNNTHFSPNHGMFNGPKVFTTKEQLITSSLNPGTEAKATTPSSTQLDNCTCIVNNETSTETTTKKATAQPLHTSTTENVPSQLDNVTTTEKTKLCPCPTEEPQDEAGNNTAANKTLSVTESYSKESSTWSQQNLTLLFLQLDEMANKVNNEELKEILKTLKSFKTAFEFNSTNNNCITTETLPPAKKGLFTVIKEMLFGRRRQVETKSIELSTGIQMNNSKSTSSFNENNPKDLNFRYITSSDSSLVSSKLPEVTTAKTVISKTITLLNDTSIAENLADIKSAFLHLNDSSIKHSIEAVINSTVLKTNLANHEDLMRMKEILMSSLSKSHKDTQNNYQLKAIKTEEDSSKNKNSNQMASFNADLLEKLGLWAANLSKNLDLASPTSNQDDTKITISITSNGNFKNIQVEQAIADKNLEISEKENMNMRTPNSQARSMDMMGTGSRQVNILKQPEKKGPYAEPILSETYSDTSRFRTKPPLSIYWHKVEEKPLKFKRIHSEAFKAPQSDDLNDNENARRGNEEYVSTMLRREIDYENIPHAQESESCLLT